MRQVHAATANGAYGQTIQIGSHELKGDEGAGKGGDDTGPTPHEYLLAALASCMSMTVMAYARHKGLPLRHVDVRVQGRHEDNAFIIEPSVTLDGDLDAAQRARVLEIAGRCPVAKTLNGEIRIAPS